MVLDLVNMIELKANNIGGTLYEGGRIDLPDEILQIDELAANSLVYAQRQVTDRAPTVVDEKKFLLTNIAAITQ